MHHHQFFLRGGHDISSSCRSPSPRRCISRLGCRGLPERASNDSGGRYPLCARFFVRAVYDDTTFNINPKKTATDPSIEVHATIPAHGANATTKSARPCLVRLIPSSQSHLHHDLRVVVVEIFVLFCQLIAPHTRHGKHAHVVRNPALLQQSNTRTTRTHTKGERCTTKVRPGDQGRSRQRSSNGKLLASQITNKTYSILERVNWRDRLCCHDLQRPQAPGRAHSERQSVQSILQSFVRAQLLSQGGTVAPRTLNENKTAPAQK